MIINVIEQEGKNCLNVTDLDILTTQEDISCQDATGNFIYTPGHKDMKGRLRVNDVPAHWFDEVHTLTCKLFFTKAELTLSKTGIDVEFVIQGEPQIT